MGKFKEITLKLEPEKSSLETDNPKNYVWCYKASPRPDQAWVNVFTENWRKAGIFKEDPKDPQFNSIGGVGALQVKESIICIFFNPENTGKKTPEEIGARMEDVVQATVAATNRRFTDLDKAVEAAVSRSASKELPGKKGVRRKTNARR